MAKIGIISSNPEDKPDSYFITATSRGLSSRRSSRGVTILYQGLSGMRGPLHSSDCYCPQHQKPRPFFRANTPSIQRFSVVRVGYKAERAWARLQKRGSRPTPSSTRNLFKA